MTVHTPNKIDPLWLAVIIMGIVIRHSSEIQPII
jgi:hypothetical protein